MFQKTLISVLIAIAFLAVTINGQGHLPTCTAALQNRHFRSEVDCESYWTCFNLDWIPQRCPDPFWFHFEAQVCRIPEEVPDCPFAPPTVPPTTTTTLPTTTIPTTIPTVSTPIQPPVTSDAPVTNPGTCPPSGIFNMTNPVSCTRYFLCFNGVPTDRSCSPGLYFSRAELRCVRRADSDCALDENSCPADDDPNNIVFLPDQEDCQRFFVCNNGSAVEQDCGPSLHWDPSNDWCILEEDSKCEPSYPLPEVREIECPEDTESDIIFLPHPEECQFYFICLDGVSILARCARNMLFDYVIENCFFAESARCFNRHPAMLN